MLVKSSKRIIPLVLLILLAGCVTAPALRKNEQPISLVKPASNTEGSLQPALPALPTNLPKPRSHRELDWPETLATKSLLQETKLSLGVGQLRPADLSSFTISGWETNPLIGTGWLSQVKLPLYTQPGGTLRGWLANGWVLHQTDAAGNHWRPEQRALTVESIVYKGTVNTLIVLEIRPEGWFRLRYAEPNSTDDGTAWAHISHLSLSEIKLTVEPWEKWFAQERMLYVRGGSYPIHTQASSQSKIITQIGEPGTIVQDKFYTLEPLEFQGDWVKVRIKMPNEYCAISSEPRQEPQVYEGWLQWRTPEQGSRIWYYSSC